MLLSLLWVICVTSDLFLLYIFKICKYIGVSDRMVCVSFAHSASLFMHTLIHTKFQILKKEKKKNVFHVPTLDIAFPDRQSPPTLRISYYAVSVWLKSEIIHRCSVSGEMLSFTLPLGAGWLGSEHCQSGSSGVETFCSWTSGGWRGNTTCISGYVSPLVWQPLSCLLSGVGEGGG